MPSLIEVNTNILKETKRTLFESNVTKILNVKDKVNKINVIFKINSRLCRSMSSSDQSNYIGN